MSTAPSANGTEKKTGLKIDRVFSEPQVHPFDQIQWARRDAEIKDEKGNYVFKQENVEFPSEWSQLAVNIVASKYFYGDATNGNGSPSDGKREWSVKQLMSRVADTIATWGRIDGYFATVQDADTFRDELCWLLANQHAAFNSPVWFNCGIYAKYGVKGNTTAWRWDKEQKKVVPLQSGESYQYPQMSACFIQGVDDNMDSIMNLAKSEAMLFKAGSGTGTDLSTLRSTKEKLSGGGKPSGPVSFFRVYDTIASIVKSGGVTRRAARMQTLHCEHPDVLEFIECKGKEDKKARALIDAGYSSGMTGDADEAYSSVAFQNTNISIRVTDEFMRKATGEDPDPYYWTKAVVDGRGVEKLNAKDVLRRIAEETWACGDPGLQYTDTINRWNTAPNTSAITSSNPCCFRYFTYVDTSEGRIPIGELAEMDAAGKELPYAFAFDRTTGMPVLRKIKRAWKAGETKTITRVTTHRGLVFESTPEHRYLMHDGEYVEAALLRPDERLRKINRQVNAKRANRKWLLHKVTLDHPNGCSPQNRWMWEQVHGPLSDEFEVHHVNEDPTDDRLSNFDVIESGDHQSLHSRGSGNPRFIDVDPRVLVEIWEAVDAQKQRNFKQRKGVTPCRWNKYIKDAGLKGLIPMAQSPTTGGHIQGKTWAEFAEWIESQRALVNDRVEKIETIELDEPAVVFDIEVDDVHNFAIGSKDSVHSIVVSNSEYVYLPDSACNLASLNLMKFVDDDGFFEADRFAAAVRIFIIAQDIIVDRASYPTEKIARNSHDYRPLGLGFANLGALLMTSGLPYDSDAGRSYAAGVAALMQGVAAQTSVDLAKALGPFNGFESNREPAVEVMRMHQAASVSGWREAYGKQFASGPISKLWESAYYAWDDAVQDLASHGYRNGQLSVTAPTGTISFLMGCATTGIEPDIALVKYKKLSGGGTLKYVNHEVRRALKTLGYEGESIAVVDGDPDHGNVTNNVADDAIKWIEEKGSLKGFPLIDPEHLPVFDCAFPVDGGRCIDWRGHVEMLAATQPFISGSQSKSINMPNSATVDDIVDAYVLCWELGVKSAAIYRDGSKGVQPLNTKKSEAKDEPTPVVAAPQRKRLPDTRQSVTHKFDIGGHEGYITVGLYPDGKPGEIFVQIAKEGSTVSGLLDSWATMVSLGLQYGVPLEVLVNKFAHSRYEPNGFTKSPDVPIAKSLTDYISRWLGCRFIEGYREANSPAAYDDWSDLPKPSEAKATPKYQQDSPVCVSCGAITVRAGTCYTCTQCGSTSGCG